MSNRFSGVIAIAALSLLSTAALAGEFFETDGVALRGYDPVAYFADGQPHKGSEAFWFAFDDAVYLFRNAEHRATLLLDGRVLVTGGVGSDGKALASAEKG